MREKTLEKYIKFEKEYFIMISLTSQNLKRNNLNDCFNIMYDDQSQVCYLLFFNILILYIEDDSIRVKTFVVLYLLYT